jgi:hypothetical protein
MTKKERLAQVEQAANDAYAEVKESKSESHKLPEVITISELSEHSREVFETFGLDAPALLNQYACAVEDGLIEQIARVKEYRSALETINIERKKLDLENSLLHRRLNLISELIRRKQVDDISQLMQQPL